MNRCTNHDSRYTEKGFSLLEVIFVLALIVTILGVSILRMQGMADQKNSEIARSDLRVIQTALHAYYLKNALSFPPESPQEHLLNENPRLLRQYLYDPFHAGNVKYSYHLSENGKYYVVFSYGPNQVANILGIDNDGKLIGQNDDDIFITNGTGTF